MIKTLFVALLSVLCLSSTSFAQTNKITVAWDAICNTNVTTYIFYYGTNVLVTPRTNVYPAYVDDCGVSRPISTNVYKGSYTLTQNVLGYTNTSTVISNLTKGSKYYMVLTSKTFNGLESDQSNEIEFTIPLFGTNTVPSKVSGIRIISIQ